MDYRCANENVSISIGSEALRLHRGRFSRAFEKTGVLVVGMRVRTSMMASESKTSTKSTLTIKNTRAAVPARDKCMYSHAMKLDLADAMPSATTTEKAPSETFERRKV